MEMTIVCYVCLILALFWLCPRFEPHYPHVPHSHFVELVMPTPLYSAQAGGSGGGAVPFVGSTQDVTNDIIRRSWEPPQAHAVMANFSRSMSPALLASASGAST
jgi:hypothetical protein